MNAPMRTGETFAHRMGEQAPPPEGQQSPPVVEWNAAHGSQLTWATGAPIVYSPYTGGAEEGASHVGLGDPSRAPPPPPDAPPASSGMDTGGERLIEEVSEQRDDRGGNLTGPSAAEDAFSASLLPDIDGRHDGWDVVNSRWAQKNER